MKQNNKKIIVCSEIMLMILSSFAFAFIIGGMTAFSSPVVSAVESGNSNIISSRCCLAAKDGSICQNMNPLDGNLCKDSLLFTDCSQVDTCAPGCCYNANEGSCSLNAPKQKCVENGGTWTNDKTCNIPQCNIGCCLIADQASVTTIRECSLLSDKYGVKPNFQNLDSDGSCDSKTKLNVRGACLTSAKDYSGLNDCKITTKEMCKTGEFMEGFLCTAPELNTTCKPKQDTTCVEGKDQIFFIDSCGNPSNIYDAAKYSDRNYWTKIVEPASSCAVGSKDCGNCDYMTGSICKPYRSGKDTKATMGNNVCRNLNCLNNRKNGESWCIEDYGSDKSAVAPVGSRAFVGKCLNGEISIEQCQDFNQQICIQQKNDGFTEAACAVNDWRSCLAANSKDSYEEVKNECDNYEQCVLFLDIPGNDKYLDLPGFKKDIMNVEQGAAGDQGKESNPVIAHCVPKNTPGMVFWSVASSSSSVGISSTGEITGGKQESAGDQYGGSLEETKSICSQGSFTCYTRFERWVSSVDKGSWEPKENMECMLDGYDFGDEALNFENKNKQQAFIEGVQERCASLGPCGVKVNIAGDLGANAGNNFKRIEIDPSGNPGTKKSLEDYVFNSGYLSSLKSKAGTLTKPGSMNRLTGAAIAMITGMSGLSEAVSAVESVNLEAGIEIENAAATTASNALPPAGSSAGSSTGLTATLEGIGGVAMGALQAAGAGYAVGQIVGAILGLDSTQTQQLSISLAAAGVTIYLATSVKALALLGPYGWIAAAAVFIYTIFDKGDESKWYVTEYSCEPWQPPKQGSCDSCNKDIRACSEYRCKSLGQNCKYYIENGEPGYCAAGSEIWSAKITPWQEALSEGNKYSDITGTNFKIQGVSSDGKVEAWKPLEFGIETDKPATCKLDTKHTASYDEMSYEMAVEIPVNTAQEAQQQTQGYYHKIVLSPHVLKNSSASSTPPLASNEENNYYIRCKNFAGQTNSAEFAVRVITNDGQDLTPPQIKGFNPPDGSYLKVGQNSTKITLLVDEPSNCKYSAGTDSKYEDMTGNLTCVTDPEASYLGQWPCYTLLGNIKTGENKFFFQCQDQPNIAERISNTRNINRNSKDYTLKVCDKGLEITSIEPQDSIITGKDSASVEVKVETAGCINGGEAVCSYKFEGEGYGENYIPFLNTGTTKHSQLFTDMPTGENQISIKCEDNAGNMANGSLKATVFLDNTEPAVARVYVLDKSLRIITNENAQCRYTTNKQVGCGFDFNSNNQSLVKTMIGEETQHEALWSSTFAQNYYIKCSDVFNNTNAGCGIIVKA